MATTIAVPRPVAGRPQPPIWPLVQGNNGGFLAVRSSPAQGSCGVSSYPCKHPGLDVVGKPGSPVVAPEDGQVVLVGDGNASPVKGYGPWVVIMLGASGRFHLIGHMAIGTSSMAPIGSRVRAGQQIGTVSHAYHVHWEVRRRMLPGAGQTNFTNNLDPIAWLRSSSSSAALLLLGAAALTYYLVGR